MNEWRCTFCIRLLRHINKWITLCSSSAHLESSFFVYGYAFLIPRSHVCQSHWIKVKVPEIKKACVSCPGCDFWIPWSHKLHFWFAGTPWQHLVQGRVSRSRGQGHTTVVHTFAQRWVHDKALYKSRLLYFTLVFEWKTILFLLLCLLALLVNFEVCLFYYVNSLTRTIWFYSKCEKYSFCLHYHRHFI